MNRKYVILPSTQRGGTTTLFQTLQKHPKVSNETIKEKNLFTLSSNTIQEEIQNYKNLFDKQFCLDFSVYYSLNPLVTAQKIQNNLGDVKIIMLLREPAERVWSAYLHQGDSDLRSFKEILHAFKGVGRKYVCEKEDEYVEHCIRENKINLNNFIYTQSYRNSGLFHYTKGVSYNELTHFAKGYPFRYFSMSQYKKVIDAYSRVFDDVLLMSYEWFYDNFQKGLHILGGFLRLDLNGYSWDSGSVTKKPTLINELGSVLLSKRMKSYVKGLIPSQFRFHKPVIKKEDKFFVNNLLKEDYEIWDELNKNGFRRM